MNTPVGQVGNLRTDWQSVQASQGFLPSAKVRP